MPAQLTRLPTAITGANQTRLHEHLAALNSFLGISGGEWDNQPGTPPNVGWDQVTAFNDKLSAVAGKNLVEILQEIDNFNFAGGLDTHFAGDDLTADGNRTHAFAGFSLAIEGASSFRFESTGINTLVGSVAGKFLSSSTSLGGAIQLFGGSGFNSNYVGIKARDNLSNTQNYVLPDALPAVSGYLLSSTTAGVMSWVPDGGGTDTNFANDNLTADGTRVHEWGGNSLTINNMSAFSATSTTTYNMTATNQITTFTPVVRLKSLSGSATAPTLTFTEADASVGEHYVAFKAADELAGNSNYTWPAALPAANDYVLTSSTGGVMSWQAGGATDTHLGNTALAADASYSHNWGGFNLTFTSVGQLDLTTSSGSNFLFAGAAQFTTFSLDILNDTPTSGGQLNLREATTHVGGHFVGIQGPDANMASSYTLELPAAGPTTNGQALTVASGGGTADVLMEWTTPAGGADTTFADTNLTSTADRTHTFTGHSLTINNASNITLNTVGTFHTNATTQVTLEAPITRLDGAAASSTAAKLRLTEGTLSGSDYVELKAPDSVTTSVSYTLPEAPGSAGLVLSSTTGGVMSWVTNGGAGADLNFFEDNLVADTHRSHSMASFDLTIDAIQTLQLNSALFYFRSTQGTEPAALDIFESTNAGNDYVRLAPPAALTNTYTLEFPAASGTAGQVLSVQSVSVDVHTLEWTTPSGGGPDTNFATDNLTASATRTHNWANFDLNFTAVNKLDVTTTSGSNFLFAGAATFTTFSVAIVNDTASAGGFLQLFEPSNFGPINYVGLEAPSSNMSESYSMTLPASVPASNGQFLKVASGAGGSSPILEFGDELNRKEGADDLGNVTGPTVNVDFDAGSYDNKRYTITGDLTFNVLLSGREGTYRMYLSADGTKRQIGWTVSEDSESVRPTYIAANDTLVVTLIQRGGVYTIWTSDTTRQTITGGSIGATLSIDTGGVYRNWEITSDAAGFELDLPGNMPANTTMEIEFSSNQSVVPTLDAQWINMSPAPTHSNRCIYVIRRTGASYYICRKDEE